MSLSALSPYRIVRSARRKRNALQLLPDGILEIRATPYTSENELIHFAITHLDWISKVRQKYLKRQQSRNKLPPDTVYISGIAHQICHAPDILNGCMIEENIIHVGGQINNISKTLEQWLKRKAEVKITARVKRVAADLDLTPYIGTIRITQTRSRWGSCNTKGNLGFCWRLIMAPPIILDYVIIHELCHLHHFNHSASFWRAVREIDPDWEAHRQWLHDNIHIFQIPNRPE